MDPTRFLEDCVVAVPEETYVVLESDRDHPNAFATIRDGNETTVVVAADEFDGADALDVEPDWRRLSFEVVLPFELVGFLAEVSSALAEAGVSIFVLSAYSTDHIFVKEVDLEPAIATLEELGCTVERG